MNWEALGAIAELIGAIGVVVTLVYLAVQIRSNTRATRIASFHSTTDSLNQVNLLIASNREISAMFAESFEETHDWDKEATTQWNFILLAIYRIFESAYFQRNEGLVEEQSWTRYDHSLRRSLQSKATVVWWNSQQFGFTDEFCDYVNAALNANELNN